MSSKLKAQSVKLFMNKYLLILFLLITGCLSGCENKSGISQLWFYTYSSDPDPDKSSLTPSNFLELRNDKSFTSDLGKFQTGHWDFKDQQLFLHADNGEINILLVNFLKSKEMQVQTGNSKAANFDGQPVPETVKDPFSRSNNLWRKTATAKETDEQLKSRLRNHCSFWVSYFNWALDNELTTVDVRSTPSPIKIYGNGFTIKPYNDLPDTWKGYFYDSADCTRATMILEDIVRKHTIAWPHTDNKYKLFISAFQQMQHLLR
jgi:hypothetical protein